MEARSLGVFKARGKDWYSALGDICGGVLLVIPFGLFLWPAWRNRKGSLPFSCVGIVFVGSFCETIYYTHYAAPATAAILLLLVYAMKELRKWSLDGKATGRFLSRAVPAAACLMFLAHEGVRLYRQEPIQATKPVNARKGLVEQVLREQKGGQHVVLVRYTREKTPHEEWIYNRADIDASDVVWAHDMGAAENRKIVDYFKGRSIWLMQPDEDPERVEPY